MSKKTLVKESVIRRWGKLANMAPLTETWLEEQDEEEDVAAAAGDEIAAGEAEVEAGEEAEASVEETEAVERIVNAVVDAISDETGVAIEVEGDEAAGAEGAMDDMDAGMDASDELDDAADAEMDDADAAAMRNPYNRRDINERGGKAGDEDNEPGEKGRKDYTAKRERPGADKRKGAEKRGAEGTKKKDGEDAYANNRKDETLNIDVIDDENLTEAVLQRVVERLLRRK
jgi:hypothetical protein